MCPEDDNNDMSKQHDVFQYFYDMLSSKSLNDMKQISNVKEKKKYLH